MEKQTGALKFIPRTPPREFRVGKNRDTALSDCGKIKLEPDEQITFILPEGAEYDITRKKWGFYATPSLNGRLKKFGLRGVLIKNRGTERFFVLLVKKGKEDIFKKYCAKEDLVLVTWLDSSATLKSLEQKLR